MGDRGTGKSTQPVQKKKQLKAYLKHVSKHVMKVSRGCSSQQGRQKTLSISRLTTHFSFLLLLRSIFFQSGLIEMSPLWKKQLKGSKHNQCMTRLSKCDFTQAKQTNGSETKPQKDGCFWSKLDL
jgi:hypothetical protein